MTQFITVDKVTGRVLGIQSGSGDPPPDTATHQFVTTPTIWDEFHAMQRSMREARRTDPIEWDGAKLVAPPDRRRRYRVRADKTELSADGVDAVTLTVSALAADGTVDTSFNATRRVWLAEMYVSLTFVAGVAHKALKTTRQGEITIETGPAYRVEAPLTLHAVAP